MVRIKFLLACFLVLTLTTSCENEVIDPVIIDGIEEGETPEGEVLLVSQIIEIDEDGEDPYVTTFFYEGRRLIREEDGEGFVINYIYENDQLVGTTAFYDGGEQDIVETFSYDSQGRLESFTIDLNDEGEDRITEYSFNDDGSIVEEYRDGSLIGRNIISGGNLTSQEFISSGEVTFTNTYTYDNMNPPLKNIEFRERIFITPSENMYTEYMNNNNILSAVDNQGTYNYSYTYNDAGYPVTIVEEYEGIASPSTCTYTLTYITAE